LLFRLCCARGFRLMTIRQARREGHIHLTSRIQYYWYVVVTDGCWGVQFPHDLRARDGLYYVTRTDLICVLHYTT
jgi:hypothetical protein